MINGLSVNDWDYEAYIYGALIMKDGELVVSLQKNLNWSDSWEGRKDECGNYYYPTKDDNGKDIKIYKYLPLKMNDFIEKKKIEAQKDVVDLFNETIDK